jgi:general secretion pathway protein D
MQHPRKAAIFGALLLLVPMVLAGCTLNDFIPKKGKRTDVQDRQQELSREDFDDLNKIDKLLPKDAKADASLGAPPVPDLAQVLAAPHAPKVGNAKLVTLSVTDDVPLRDVLFELGRLADIDIEVGPGLDGRGINLRATDRPFNEVIERIATLANLRYSVSGNSIRVERDLPYIKNYKLDFLNIVRSSTNSYNLSTNILSAGGGSSGGGGGSSSGSSSSSGSGSGSTSVASVGNSGSSASITASSDSDLWSSLEASITEIINYSPAGAETDAAAASGGASAGGGGAGGGSSSTGAGGGSGAENASFVINRQAGVISVNASERQHEMVQRFLDLMQRNAAAQVLIEAKIVEVSLTNQFQSGVDWNKFIGNVEGLSANVGTYGATNGLAKANAAAANNSDALTIGIDGLGLDTVISMIERYGTTRTLSSPRLSAINNQQAVLTFARNEVFFDCTVTPPTTTSTTSTAQTTPPTVDCTPQTVPIGILLNILPAVNLETQEVTLSVRPTLTRLIGTGEVNPETQYIQSLINSTTPAGSDAPQVPDIRVPVVEVREIDSVMKVKSGGVMVIGGLMEDSTDSQQDGVPGAKDLPIVGNLFKSRVETMGKRELIIFIKATIINSDGSSGPVDRAVMKKYTTDPRPLFQ